MKYIAELTGSNPVEALIFFRLLSSNCLNWQIYCDDHSSLSETNDGISISRWQETLAIHAGVELELFKTKLTTDNIHI